MSIIRFEKPHSLSYQLTTRASLPSRTAVSRLSTVELAGKLDGSSIRVPTPNVSVVDLKVVPSRDVTKDEINAAMAAAAQGPMKGVLAVWNEPLVSSDFNHTATTSNVALPQTQVIEGKLVRVLSWYDNEWAFATKLADTAMVMAKFL